MDVPRMDRSLGELFSDLSQQTADLIRQEMRLAKAELSEKAADVGRHAMMIGAGVAFGLAAIVGAMLGLRRLGLEPVGPVLLQSVVEEESGGNGALQCLISGHRADAAVIPEPYPGLIPSRRSASSGSTSRSQAPRRTSQRPRKVSTRSRPPTPTPGARW